MTTINCELSKKLNDLGLLDNIDTEFMYTNIQYDFGEMGMGVEKELIDYNYDYSYEVKNAKRDYLRKYGVDLEIYKALTLEEAIEFILDYIGENGSIQIGKDDVSFFPIDGEKMEFYKGRINIKIIEKMLEYLLDN